MSDRPKRKSGADRRLDERVPTQIRVRLKYPDVETFLERYATNISRGGIFLQTQRTKPPGTLIRFEFQLQDASPVIRGEGRVSWVVAYDPAHAERAYGMGVKFTRLDARSKSFIDRIVAQKIKRGQSDNPNAPPPPEEARLGPVRDVTAHDATAGGEDAPRGAAASAPGESAALAAAVPATMDPVLPADVEELLASAPAIDLRALSARVLGGESFDLETLDRLLAEIDAALAASGKPVAVPVPRRAVMAPPDTLPMSAQEAPAEPPAGDSAASPEPQSEAEAEPPAGDSAASPESEAEPQSESEPQPEPQPPTGESAASPEAGGDATEPAPRVPVGEPETDRLLDQAAADAFALDLEEMAAPPPDTSSMRRTPAPQARRTPAPPRRRSERALERVAPPPEPEPEPPPAEEPGAPPPFDAFEGEMGTLALSPSELAAAVAAAAEANWEEGGAAFEGTEPSVQLPTDGDLDADLLPGFGDAGASTVESPPDFTPPVGEEPHEEVVSLLGIQDPFAPRAEDDAFSMDVGPLLEDSEGGPPAERTMIGGAGFDFDGASMPDRSDEDRGLDVTATHPPMATAETEGEEGGFFEGDISDVPPDAGAQAGLPELDEPLVDDFEQPRGLETFEEVDVTPHDGVEAAPRDESADQSAGLDESFVYAQTVQAQALPDDVRRNLGGDGMPDLLIDEGPLDASSSSEEVTARQSPLPPAPEEEDPDSTSPDGESKKGFFRKLFRNK